jgi:hypothetical protein
MAPELYRSAYHSLSSLLTPIDASWQERDGAWRAFQAAVVVSFPTDDVMPSASDSGYHFARKAKFLLDVPESRILRPDQVVELGGASRFPLVLVDDFAGSGAQMRETWHRKYSVPGQADSSLADLHAAGALESAFYCPLLSTSVAIEHLADRCPGLELHPTHVLPEEYGVMHSETLLVPAEFAGPRVRKFLEASAEEAGIPPGEILGFANLGLAIGFEDAPPDSTLPVYWKEGRWEPLFNRP